MNKFDEATNLRNNGQEEKAITLYKELIASHENEGYCWQMIGVCFNILKKPNEAREAIQKAIDIFSTKKDSFNLSCAYRDMGLSYLGNDQTKEAIQWLKKSLQEYPQAVTLGKMGLAYFKSGNPTEARKYLKEALEKETDWFMKATILLDLSKLELAEKHPDQVIKNVTEAKRLIIEAGQAKNQKRRMEQIEEMLLKARS